MISFLPMAHMFERVVQSVIYTKGGKVGFFGGDICALNEDMKALRPTLIPVVPRVLNRLHDKVMLDVNQSLIKSIVFKLALAYKTYELNKFALNTFALTNLVGLFATILGWIAFSSELVTILVDECESL